jgi:DNA modification methylase
MTNTQSHAQRELEILVKTTPDAIIKDFVPELLALCEKLLRSCKQETGYVLIPFAGSGSECVAAKQLGLPFVGMELNETYVELIHERLKNNTT